MTTYKCKVEYRDYQNWTYVPENKDLESPNAYKLFHDDEFEYNNKELKITHSPTRKNLNIPGILILENNRTYGRTLNRKRLYYKCRPHDTKLPHFLVPFDMPMGFNKNFKNKYVTFFFDKWNDKHPCGTLSQNLGDVYHFPSYCEYILYCKQLHESITASIAQTKAFLRETSTQEYQLKILNNPKLYGVFENREQDYIFSIDPEGCVDRDDALSIVSTPYDTYNIHKISVYIANVWVWLDVLDLWHLVGSRASTVYFPIMKRPMLPTSVGEQLCSLDQAHRRFGFVMDFIIKENEDKELSIIETPTLKQCVLKVSQNYDYEEPSLLQDEKYIVLQRLTKQFDHTVNDSHDVVAYWMMQMNNCAAKLMKAQEIGIFRTVRSKCPDAQVPSNAPTFLKILEQQLSGSYQVYCKDDNLCHEVLGFSEYIHFTSPIRRMVDLLNQIRWVEICVKPVNLNEKVSTFYTNQVNNIDVLNAKMKKIRRLQSDCDILYKVTNNPEFMDRNYEATVVSSDTHKCMIYIEPLQWLAQIKTATEYVKYDKISCKIYVFEKEEQMKKKVKVQIL